MTKTTWTCSTKCNNEKYPYCLTSNNEMRYCLENVKSIDLNAKMSR